MLFPLPIMYTLAVPASLRITDEEITTLSFFGSKGVLCDTAATACCTSALAVVPKVRL